MDHHADLTTREPYVKALGELRTNDVGYNGTVRGTLLEDRLIWRMIRRRLAALGALVCLVTDAASAAIAGAVMSDMVSDAERPNYD